MENKYFSIELSSQVSRNYLTSAERQRFIETALCASRPEIQTFALTLAYTGCRISEALSLRACDVDIHQELIYLFTKRKNKEHWREIPVPKNFMRALELVHSLRKMQADDRLLDKELWSFSRTSAFRHISKLMALAKITGPQATSRGLRHGFSLAAIQAGVPLPTIAAILGLSSFEAAAQYTVSLVGLTDLTQIERMW